MNKFYRFLGTMALAVIGLCCASFPALAQEGDAAPSLDAAHVLVPDAPSFALHIEYSKAPAFEQSFGATAPFSFTSTDSDLVMVLFCHTESQTKLRLLNGATLYGLYGLNGRELRGSSLRQAMARYQYRNAANPRQSTKARSGCRLG